MPRHARTIAFAALALSTMALAPQEASARYNCAVKSTKDGFVALREGPAASSKLIARMKKDEIVGLLHPPDYENLVRKGNWIYVRYVPGSVFDEANKADYDKAIPGWVNGRLLDCHE
jgi:hypothetical protein